jgi:hypothetical protein
MNTERTDALNLFTPLVDGVESAGQVGEVLKSRGGLLAPVWGSASSGAYPPGGGSIIDTGGTAGPVLEYISPGTFSGVLALVPPEGTLSSGGAMLHIQGFDLSSLQTNQGVIDLMVQIDMSGANVRQVTTSGVSPDIEVRVGFRPSDGRLCVLLGEASTLWEQPNISITRVWTSGDQSANTWLSDWSLAIVPSVDTWSLYGAQPVGPSLELAPPLAGPGSGGGRLTIGMGGVSAPTLVTGVLTWMLSETLPPETVVQLVGCGRTGGTDSVVNCWIRLRADANPANGITQVDVINLAPTLPPTIRCARNGAGRSLLLVGDDDSTWTRPSFSLAMAVTTRSAGAAHRPYWPYKQEPTAAIFTITATGSVRAIAGSAGGGAALENLTAGQWLLGGTYNGIATRTFSVDGSSGPDANKVAVRDGQGDLYAVLFHGDLDGEASAAGKLATPRLINGVPFDGTNDIIVEAVEPGSRPALTPGTWLSGDEYNGSIEVTWTVVAQVGAVPTTLAARDGAGDLFAGTFHGALDGLASSATKLATPRTINGVPFDGTANITITPTSAGTLTPGNYITGSAYNGSTSQNWAVDGSVAATASKVAVRNASGELLATRFLGNLAGNSDTTTRLATPRLINGVPFDGTSDISLTVGAVAPLTPGTYLSGGVYNGLAPTTWTVNAATAATPSTVAARDGSGRITAVSFIGDLQGRADTANALATSRTINGVPFNGSTDIVIPSGPGAGLVPGAYVTGATYDGTAVRTWAVDATPATVGGKVVARDALGDVNVRQVFGALRGNADTATKLQTARLINGVPFDGSQDITISGGGGGGVTNLSVANNTATTLDVASDTGTDATLPAATGSLAGLFTAAGFTKLSGIAAGATVNSPDAALVNRASHTGTQLAATISDFGTAVAAAAPPTNLSLSVGSTTIDVLSSTGTDVTLPAATGSTAGLFTGADSTKLAGIASGATANSSDATLLNRANHTGTQAGSTVTGLYTASGLTMATARMLGRTTGATGAAEEISIGSGLSLSAGVLSSTGSGSTNLSLANNTANTLDVNSDTGTDVTLPAATGSLAGLFTATGFTKLAGIASGATANSSDATLLARANHTGTQAGSTVTGLYSAAGLTLNTARILGRTTAAVGAAEEISIGSGLLLSGGTLSSTATGATNLSLANNTATTLDVLSDTGTDVTLPAATGSLAGLFTSAGFTKLSGIATGATANSSDATLLARANHTGTQAGSTVTGLYTASGLTLSTARILGRTTAASGAAEEITIGAGLQLTGGSLVNTGVAGDAATAYLTTIFNAA